VPLIAKQQINSGYGTFQAGHGLSDSIPPHVVDAWIEAGIVEDTDSSSAVIETATAPAVETATAPRQTSEKAAHVRLTKPKAVGSKPASKG